MNHSEGQWHATLGLDPQYDHMKDTGSAYADYMCGYNSIAKEDKAAQERAKFDADDEYMFEQFEESNK